MGFFCLVDSSLCVPQPLVIDLYCGLGGWADGFLLEGYTVVGFDVVRHDYGDGVYPGQLVIQDARTLDGAQFRRAACIVASPPCQEYSYRAMPWSRVRTLPPPSNELWDACFRIQREASAAAGHHIPLIVENVRGAQRWVGPAAWHFGSYYLWGDVPALMPFSNPRGSKNAGHVNRRDGYDHTRSLTCPEEGAAVNGAPRCGWFGEAGRRADPLEGSSYSFRSVKMNGSGRAWFDKGFTRFPSRSPRRRAASARIAKIPLVLAQHIAQVYKPAA